MNRTFNDQFSGAGGGQADGIAAGQIEDKRLETIRNLLSKAEATEFPQEAETFFAKASELISRWAIDEAMIWDGQDRSGREHPEELQMIVHGPYLVQKSVLVGAVAGANGCKAVRLGGGPSARSEIVSIVGFPSDLRWVETLVTSLLLQLTAAMLAASPKGLRGAETASWRRSFIVGYADEVGARLKASRREAMAQRSEHGSTNGTAGGGVDRDSAAEDAGDSVALVLASRSEEVAADFERRYPFVRTTWASSGRSITGRNAGRMAGKDASLTRGGLRGRRSLGPG